MYKSIMLERCGGGASYISQINGKFNFDKGMGDGELDNTFNLIPLNIYLIEYDEEDSYYDGAEFDEPKRFKKTQIGEIFSHYYDIERMQFSEYYLMDVFDMHDGDEYQLGCDIFDSYWNTLKTEITDKLSPFAPHNFFHIDKIELFPQYRQQGYGTALMKNIEKMIFFGLHLPCSFISLQANPLDEDKHDNPQEEKKLQKFYRKCGFKKIGKDNTMIKFVEEYLDKDK